MDKKEQIQNLIEEKKDLEAKIRQSRKEQTMKLKRKVSGIREDLQKNKKRK